MQKASKQRQPARTTAKTKTTSKTTATAKTTGKATTTAKATALQPLTTKKKRQTATVTQPPGMLTRAKRAALGHVEPSRLQPQIAIETAVKKSAPQCGTERTQAPRNIGKDAAATTARQAVASMSAVSGRRRTKGKDKVAAK